MYVISFNFIAVYDQMLHKLIATLQGTCIFCESLYLQRKKWYRYGYPFYYLPEQWINPIHFICQNTWMYTKPWFQTEYKPYPKPEADAPKEKKVTIPSDGDFFFFVSLLGPGNIE